ncbi:uroporphyrin-III methyltransferase [Erythrobacter sp. HI00D59]|nr:uroporphyrin-III methyltransferase [Erythrobacter sp. HI00D59]
MAETGTIYLVGAGPGDPDLLTIRAARLIERARTIVHDGLVDPAIMALARKDAELISVAKRRSHHTLPQEDINALLVRIARSGEDVVRLKGGDPFIFGRGGEEAEVARAAGVPVEVVPGISAANGAAAAAQIALTHRDASSIVSFVAGQCKGLRDQDWAGLAGKGRTLVIYMGVKTAPLIAEKLMEDGLSPDMPVAVIENGTRPEMRVLRGLLAGLPDLVENEQVVSPALIVIGEVTARDDVALAATAWEAAR